MPARTNRDGYPWLLAVLSVLVLVSSHPALAASPALSGSVADTSGQPLAGVGIELRDGGSRVVGEATTDRHGRFTIGPAEAGHYALVATKPGFRTACERLVLPSTSQGALSITLLPAAAPTLVEGLIVTGRSAGEGPTLSVTGANGYAVTEQDIANLPTGPNSPMTDVLAQMPGVAIDQNEQIHIRDTEGPQFQYQINGALVPLDINTNPPFLSMINPLFVRQLDLLDGVLPSRYSYATGGVIDIRTKDGCDQPGDEATIVFGQRGTLEPSAQLSGCQGRFGYYLSGLYAQGETAFSSATPGPSPVHDYTNRGQAFGYFSYQLDAANRLSLILSAAASRNQLPNVPNLTPLYTLQGVSNYESANINSYLNFQDYLAIFALNGSNRDGLTYQLAYSAHYISQDFRPDNAGELIFQGVASTATHVDVDNTLEGDLSYKRGAHTLGAGFYVGEYRVTVADSSLVFPIFLTGQRAFDASAAASGNPITSNPEPTGPLPQSSTTPISVINNIAATNVILGLYLDDLWQPTGRLSADIGIRFDSLSGFTNHTQVDPTVNLAYQASADATVHGGFARYMQVPSFQGISPGAPAAFLGTTGATATGDSTPLTEDDEEWDVGLVYRLGRHVTLSQDNYYELTSHYLDTGQLGVVPIFAPFNYDHGHIWGSEFAFKYNSDHLVAYLNLTLGQNWQKGVATGQFNFEPEELLFLDTHAFLLDHQPLAGASAGATYAFAGYAISVDAIYSSGLRGGFADQQRLPAMVQVNAALQRTFAVPGFGKITNRLTILNLFDRVNLIRPAEGIGIFQSAYGPRFTVLDSLTVPF